MAHTQVEAGCVIIEEELCFAWQQRVLTILWIHTSGLTLDHLQVLLDFLCSTDSNSNFESTEEYTLIPILNQVWNTPKIDWFKLAQAKSSKPNNRS